MNGGYSGIAAWMLDDAMHSSGDSGKTEDIKLWGMWNILGEEVFDDPLAGRNPSVVLHFGH